MSGTEREKSITITCPQCGKQFVVFPTGKDVHFDARCARCGYDTRMDLPTNVNTLEQLAELFKDA